MKCDEVQSLTDACLDSELDARTALEVAQHLKSCPECARRLASEQTQEARVKTCLNRGPRTAAWWEQIEQSVVAAAALGARSPIPIAVPAAAWWSAVLSSLDRQLRAGWHRSPKAWAGLAAAWVVIAVLNLTAREPETRAASSQRTPAVSEVRFAVSQKRMIMAELTGLPAQAPTEDEKTIPPKPRSERPKATLNT